jgi:polyisoprenoid-binding protein YceI
MKKNITILIVIVLLFQIASAGIKLFMPVDNESKVAFTIKNFGISSSGTFRGLAGKIKFDPQNLPESFFDVSIDAATIETGIQARDRHLKKAEYFNVVTYPKIYFVSTEIAVSNHSFFVKGKLTIKNVTKEISFPFSITPLPTGYAFKGNFSINRKDYTVGGNSAVLGDNVLINLNVHAR